MSIRLVEDVSDDTYVLDGLAVRLTPALPWLGHRVCWEMNGRLKEPVDLSRVTCNVIMKYGPVKMLERNYALRDLLGSLGARLSGDLRPAAGPWQQTWNLQLPEAVPVAELRILLRARTGSGRNFLALDIALDFSHRFRPAPAGGRAGARVLQGSHRADRDQADRPASPSRRSAPLRPAAFPGP
ncbi:hypothetical protein [Streptomyces sp. NPDC047841]|uniref:hypothetical protein n=1 Tax=Streptomyces sp. NPDC047841 TaxID=3154708 RepID=UPI0034550BCA